MLVLALDTTTRGGSVALARDGAVLDVLAGDPERPHAERLPGDLLRLLDRQGLRLTDVDVFGVAAGPGSFTGLRIGIATIQGCGFASGRPVIGVSALEALAVAAFGARRERTLPRVGVWMDAQREEVFSALYRRGDAGVAARPETVDGPTVGDPAAIAARWSTLVDREWFPVVGDGAVRYRDVLRAVPGGPVEIIEPPLVAPVLAVLAGRRAAAGERPLPHAIRPIYIRRPDAELARDRRAQERS
jgi:tRNA threonylcarbamoyladenosine biosynthesis protein TsaB